MKLKTEEQIFMEVASYNLYEFKSNWRRSKNLWKYEVLVNTNVTLHSEIEILTEYKTKLEAKEASELESEGEDPKKNEELKKIEAMHKRQLTENRKLRKENKDLKKKLAEIQNETAEQTETEHDETANNTADIIDDILAEPTQCEIPQVNFPSIIWYEAM